MTAAENHETNKPETADSPGSSKADEHQSVEPALNPIWHQLATNIQTKFSVGAPDDPFEQEADRVADEVMRMADPGQAQIISDDETRAGRTADNYPYLDRIFGFLDGRDAAYIEQTLREYVPSRADITSVGDYIPFIVTRAQQGAQTWVRTRSIGDLPSGIPTLLGAAALGSRCVGAAAENAVQFKGQGSVQPHASNSPAAIRSQLGGGRPLDGHVRSRMESAFGTGFSHVRTHADAQANGLSSRFSARAFTVGEHVAVGAGQYQPGTLVGDALIAHELAHVVQQGNGRSTVMGKSDSGGYGRLEEDADRSAVGAVAKLWTEFRVGVSDIPDTAMPRMKSGLQLQRCCSDPTTTNAFALGLKAKGEAGNVSDLMSDLRAENATRAGDTGIREVLSIYCVRVILVRRKCSALSHSKSLVRSALGRQRSRTFPMNLMAGSFRRLFGYVVGCAKTVFVGRVS